MTDDYQAGVEQSGQPPQSPQPEAQDPLLQIAWRRRWTVLVFLLAAVAVAGIYLKKATPLYTSTSRLYVEQEGPRIITDNQGVMTQSKNYLFTQCELLKSTPILATAVERPGIRDLPALANSTNPVSLLKGSLHVRLGPKDDIIDVLVDSPSAEDSAQLVNAVVDAYIDYHSKRKRSTAAEVLRILQAEKVRRDKELADRNRGVLEFKKANGVLSFEDDNVNVVTRRLHTLSTALTEAQLGSADAWAAFETAQAVVKVKGGDDAELVIGAVDGELGNRLRDAQQKMVELRSSFTDEHPLVKAGKEQVELLQRQYVAQVQDRLNIARKREERIQALFSDEQVIAEKVNIAAATYQMLLTEVKQAEDAVDLLNKRIQELNVTEDVGALNISVLETGRVEGVPTSPNLGSALGVALVLGLVFGFGAALLHDRVDQSIRSLDEIPALSGSRVLGVVPSAPGSPMPELLGQQIHIEPRSSAAEAYRAIRTAVFFGVRDGRGKILVVTSAVPGEGKSTLASNLAIAMAQSGQRTLVVDADFRKPTQHRIFQTHNESGLADVLQGTLQVDDAVQHTTLGNLDVLPCGPVPSNPSELFHSTAFGDILLHLGKSYDRILIDSQAVVPVADARVLAAMCDATILVLRAGKCTRTQVKQACGYLHAVGARLLGVVINADPRYKEQFARYYGYYASTYGGWEEELEPGMEVPLVVLPPKESMKGETPGTGAD